MAPQFRYPLTPAPRIATFSAPGFASRLSPHFESLAVPARLLPEALQSGWTPEYGIVVFTGPGCGCLTAEQRDAVWRCWGVPVYEQRVDSGGEVIAEECDYHEGLHVVAGALWGGSTLPGRCPCGLASPRISSYAPARAAVA